MENVILTKFVQEFNENGEQVSVQVIYSTYANGESFNATVNLTEADGIADMHRLNALQADSYARKKLREMLAKPGIVQTEEATAE